jgi:hypothetical protein
MARPRKYDESKLERDGDGKEEAPGRRGRPPKERIPAPSYEPPPVRRGPRTTLTEDMVPLIARDVARGASRAAAAASVRTTADCLKQWLQRGRRDVAEGKDTVYAYLLLECAASAREYELHLLELGDAAAQDKTLNVRWVTWRLGFLRPEEYTARAAEEAGTTGFALMTPEEAVQSVHQLMADFLARQKAETGSG